MVPDFQSLMLPVLRALGDGTEIRVAELRLRVAKTERLTEDDLRERVPSGQQTVFSNRVSWALTHMKRAGLVIGVRTGIYQITPTGERTLSDTPDRIDMKTLSQFDAYVNWRQQTKAPPEGELPDTTQDTPDEVLSHAAEELRTALEADVVP